MSEEREKLDNLILSGCVDTFRHFNKDPGKKLYMAGP
jgi:exodeoxyribonuclease-3